MPREPKSTHSLNAGRRASGNSWASTTTPTRMSTRANSSHDSAIAAGRPTRFLQAALSACCSQAERGEGGAGVVVLEDRGRVVAEVGHGLRPPLIEPDPVPVAAPGEARDGAIHDDGEQRALERVVSDEA